MADLNNHIDLGSWQPVMNKIIDLISTARILSNRQLLSEILQSFLGSLSGVILLTIEIIYGIVLIGEIIKIIRTEEKAPAPSKN